MKIIRVLKPVRLPTNRDNMKPKTPDTIIDIDKMTEADDQRQYANEITREIKQLETKRSCVLKGAHKLSREAGFRSNYSATFKDTVLMFSVLANDTSTTNEALVAQAGAIRYNGVMPQEFVVEVLASKVYHAKDSLRELEKTNKNIKKAKDKNLLTVQDIKAILSCDKMSSTLNSLRKKLEVSERLEALEADNAKMREQIIVLESTPRASTESISDNDQVKMAKKLEEQGLSQRKIAENMGLSQPKVCRMLKSDS